MNYSKNSGSSEHFQGSIAYVFCRNGRLTPRERSTHKFSKVRILRIRLGFPVSRSPGNNLLLTRLLHSKESSKSSGSSAHPFATFSTMSRRAVQSSGSRSLWLQGLGVLGLGFRLEGLGVERRAMINQKFTPRNERVVNSNSGRSANQYH